MKKMLLACAAFAALAVAGVEAADIPTLSEFLLICDRNPGQCRGKIHDYIVAADSQKMICRPADQSMHDAVYSTLYWLRSEGGSDDQMRAGPYDDALWTAISTRWPCNSDGAAGGKADK